MKKIDCHAHLIGISPSSGGYASAKMRRSIPFQYLLRKQGLHKLNDPAEQDAEYAKNLAVQVRGSEIDESVLLAFDQMYSRDGKPLTNQTYLYIPNEYVRQVATQYSDCFLFGASVHPYRSDCLDELQKVKEQGAKLVKLLPNSQGFDPSDPQIREYYQKAADLDLPLLFHCGFEHTIPAIDQSYGDPHHLTMALEMGVTIIIAHGGSSGRFHFKETFGSTLQLLKRYDNCFADNSAMTNYWRSKYMLSLFNLREMEKTYGVSLENAPAKFLHGTDYPIPITPWAFISHISRKRLKELGRISNGFDLDLALKRAVGFDDHCFATTSRVLGVE